MWYFPDKFRNSVFLLQIFENGGIWPFSPIMQIWWLPIAPQVDTMVVLAGVLTVGFSLKPNILFNAPIKALTLQTTMSIPAPIPLAQKQSRFYVQWIWILNNQICQIKRKTYIYGWVHVTFNVILSNIISFNIFFDICHWITFSIYNIHNCKISRWS